MPHWMKKTEQNCLNMNKKFPGSKFVWKDGSCDKIESFLDSKEYFYHKKEKLDKGVSDKSTDTGYLDIRNANYLRTVYLLHILIVVPLFLLCCIGIHYEILGIDLLRILGWLLLVYMGYGLLKSEITGNWNWGLSNIFDFNMKQDRRNSARLRIVYIFHLLIIVPLLLYVNYNKNTNKQIEGMVCILGILALLYHGYSYWKSETEGQWNWNWS